ncbi:MAG: cyclase family protein [Acidobacteria bacterium]|nr:cyclase family protein [Acidobacteriota bacterium]
MCSKLLLATALASILLAQTPKGWVKGKGYGWVYGPRDEVGALNAVTSPAQVLRALREVKTGKVYDLGVRIDHTSYKWPGHSPTAIISYRSPEGVKRGRDIAGFTDHPKKLAFHSCALFISDNVGTQIDGLGHITTGADDHWYNGFRERDYGGDFGIGKADADSIPPVIARAVMIDVASWKGVEALPANFTVGSKEMQAALAFQKVDVEPGDVVLIRTGTLRYWGETGADHAKIAAHDSAGLTLEGAKWLVEQKGAVLIGADTSGLEVGADPARPGAVNPVHEYLLIEQGVHIGEFHNLEGPARDRVYRFVYSAATNRLKGAVAGTALRPVAIQ